MHEHPLRRLVTPSMTLLLLAGCLRSPDRAEHGHAEAGRQLAATVAEDVSHVTEVVNEIEVR